MPHLQIFVSAATASIKTTHLRYKVLRLHWQLSIINAKESEQANGEVPIFQRNVRTELLKWEHASHDSASTKGWT